MFELEGKVDSDTYFMQEALKEAQTAYSKKEVPVGAVIVWHNQIIARAHNQMETLKDATAHAEMIALTQAQSYVGDWRLIEAILYVTMEPCVMCAGALVLSRIKKVVYATSDPRFGGIESFLDILDKQKISPQIEIEKDVLKEKSVSLLKQFFSERRTKHTG